MSGGTLSWNGNAVSVGTSPGPVLTFGSNTATSGYTEGDATVLDDVSGTGYALVLNMGSNSVSVVDLVNIVSDATIAVGNSPVAAAITPDASTAYVVNYADGTLSVVSLSSDSVTSTVSVGANPGSVALDASGDIWVGGPGYITELDPSTLGVLNTRSVPATVSALAVSDGTNQIVYNALANPSGSGSATVDYGTASASMQTMAMPGTSVSAISYAQGAAAPYSSSSIATSLPQAGQLGSGLLVSANYGNALSISATPTGFVVTDLNNGVTYVKGSTPGPIRSIAVDPDYGEVYLTVPDSNSVITVPLPPIPTY